MKIVWPIAAQALVVVAAATLIGSKMLKEERAANPNKSVGYYFDLAVVTAPSVKPLEKRADPTWQGLEEIATKLGQAPTP